MPVAAATLPSLHEQADRLIALSLHQRAGLTEAVVRSAVDAASALDDDHGGGALLVVHPGLVPASALAPLLRRGDREGFVVEDMTDVDAFGPLDCATPPSGPLYVLTGLDRGDGFENVTPDEALPRILDAGRTPLLLAEGVQWVLQAPDVLERNHCFMTAGSRVRRPSGRLDARTPAVWISNGTGRDGAARRNAPKVGWCWAGNRHTWLGIASAAARVPFTTGR